MNKLDSIVPRNRYIKFIFGIYNEYVSYLFTFIPFLSRKKGIQKFIIFSQGRTGSTLLVKILNSHPDIVCEREIFQLKNIIFSGQIHNPYRMINGKELIYRKKVYGFKAKIYQLNEQRRLIGGSKEFLRNATNNGWKLLYLKRGNLIQHVLSSLVAENLNTYHFNSNGEKSTYDKLKLELDVHDLIKRLDERRNYLEQEKEALEGREYMEISYEKLSEYPQEVADEIFSFLGINSVRIDIPLQKSNTKSVEELVSNYDEIASALKSTEYAKFLDLH